MDFAEKLTALLTLTGTKNARLADALGLGRPYVSRLKTGDRKLPTNPLIVQRIAAFFATRCGDEYRRRALMEFTSDARLNNVVDEAVLTAVICDWFSDAAPDVKAPAGQFLSRFSLFGTANGTADGNTPFGTSPTKSGIFAYYNNEGKRQALKDLMTYVDSLDKPVKILLFTDESYGWITEDADYIRWLNEVIRTHVKRGVTYERIQPPFTDVEFTFSAIERWLPGYMAGAVQQYYYPCPRDQLHRRTIFTVPGHIAMYADSVYGENEPPLTTLTRDPNMVEVCAKEYAAIRKRCRPAIVTYNADSESIFSASEEVAAIEDVGVYKTDALSINTLPPEIVERIRQNGTQFAKRLAASFELRTKARANVLLNNTITDIMYLPDLATVLAGREPIPGTTSMGDKALYYTPEDYRLHLLRILWYLDVYKNYHAVFTDDPVNRSVILFIKGTSRALLVKTAAPFTVFDITEPTMAAAFCDLLRRIAEEQTTAYARRMTVERINEEIRRLDAAMR